MATQISAITFVGTTGQAYTDGMSFLVFYFGLPFAMVILCVTLVPFFYRAGVYTAYQYLETRFDARTRTLTSLLFLLSRGLSVGVTLYAPSLVLSVILGWSETATILLMGGTTIVYVVYGGNKSVIWTDVVQMALIWFGIFVCVGVAIAQLPDGVRGPRRPGRSPRPTGRLEIMDTSLDPREALHALERAHRRAASWPWPTSAATRARCSATSPGAASRESRLSLLFNAFLKVPMQFLILLTGVLVFVFYHFHAHAAPLERGRSWRRLEERAPAGELAHVESAVRRGPSAQRKAAAEAFARARRGAGAEGARQRVPRGAEREVEAARAEAAACVNAVRQGRPLQRHQLHLPDLHRVAAAAAASPASSSP